jgi:hypothetical protein
MVDTNKFLRSVIQSLIDEKIAMLYEYTNDVKDWEGKKIDINFMTEKIVSDLTAIVKVKSRIDNNEQSIRLIEAIIRLTNEMKFKGYDIVKIEAVTKVLFSD